MPRERLWALLGYAHPGPPQGPCLMLGVFTRLEDAQATVRNILAYQEDLSPLTWRTLRKPEAKGLITRGGWIAHGHQVDFVIAEVDRFDEPFQPGQDVEDFPLPWKW